jgi:esterase/lipase
MARFLFEKGINVYLPRLSGHGTDPKALKKVTAEAWENDFARAFTAMRQVCDTVFIGGFSTGGLLALLHAARYRVDGVIVVNTALKLNSLQVNYVVSTLNAFNEMIEYLHARGIKEWIENDSEVSQTNYPKHPLSSVAEVERLMNKTRKALAQVEAPLLIIQGDRDPVVDPKSADLIYRGVGAADKELMLIPRTKHNILTGNRAEEADLFGDIYDAITRLQEKQKKSARPVPRRFHHPLV